MEFYLFSDSKIQRRHRLLAMIPLQKLLLAKTVNKLLEEDWGNYLCPFLPSNICISSKCSYQYIHRTGCFTSMRSSFRGIKVTYVFSTGYCEIEKFSFRHVRQIEIAFIDYVIVRV